MELGVQTTALLLLIGALVAIVSRRLHLPYSVGLVIAGAAISFFPWTPKVELTKELLFSALLPPLIFEAAFYLNWRKLRRELPVTLLLATVGVLLSALVTAGGMRYIAGWPWISATIFGILIAATDPVAVIATFREAGAHGRLLMLIESESLFNDATAAVLFAIVLQAAGGASPEPGSALLQFLFSSAGSLLCGAAVAWLALLLAGRTDDHLAEITLTTVAAWGSFLLAETFHFSGVLATLTAGLIMGNNGPYALSARGREAVQAFWEYAAFVANSLVFLLIGMHEASQDFLGDWRYVAAAILLVTAGRAVAVYLCCFLFRRSPLKVSGRHQHVLFWGGLRGALGLALALALPSALPRRESIVIATFGVVAFSVFVQGLTLSPLLRRFGEIPARPK